MEPTTKPSILVWVCTFNLLSLQCAILYHGESGSLLGKRTIATPVAISLAELAQPSRE